MWTKTLIAALLLAGACLGDDSNPCASHGGSPYDYQQALCVSVLFYEAQRSGPVSNLRLDWRQDSALGDGSDVGVDLTGGYYDAGDHVKFGFPMAFSITTIAWGIISFRAGYQTAGELANGEAAVRWGTDYFLKAHSSNQLLYGQVGYGETDHAYWGRPEDMTMSRPAYKIDTSAPGSDLAGETAAALAAASVLFQDSDSSYAATCLAAARDLFDFADNYRGLYANSITDAANYYQSFNGYGDELIWAAVWLYRATGESYYGDRAKALYTENNAQWSGYGYGWDNKYSGVQVVMAEEFGGSYTTDAQSFMNDARAITQTPGGMTFLGEWGSLRSAIGLAFIGLQAARLGIDTSTNNAYGLQQVNYALGSVGHSYVVGFGNSPPERPHHRSSSCPYPPDSCTDGWAVSQSGANPHTLYGALVGGPDQNDGWADDRNDYVKNEVACDYNASLTGALAAVIINSMQE